MKILYVTHRYPYPPTTGARVRAFACIRHLARAHEVTLVAPHTAQDDLASRELANLCAEIVTAPVSRLRASFQMAGALLAGGTLSEAYFHSPKIEERLRTQFKGRRFDVAIAHSSSVGHLLFAVAATRRIMDFVDVDSKKWAIYADWKPFPVSWFYRREARRLAAVECALAQRCDVSVVTTPTELDDLKEMAPEANATVISNGVDIGYFRSSEGPYQTEKICFLGRMDYFPNEDAVRWFALEVLPLIRAHRPGTRFSIVGANPGPKVRALERTSGVEVTGRVPDVRQHVGASALSVAPLRVARGVQNKILESAAMGVPVVCTSAAARGLPPSVGHHVTIADTAGAMAEACLRILGDRSEQRRLGEASRGACGEYLRWDTVLTAFNHIVAPDEDKDFAPGRRRLGMCRPIGLTAKSRFRC